MIITASLLNELENKFTAHGLGYELIAESELTYQKCINAIENGYLPIVPSGFYLRQIYNEDSEYRCLFSAIDGAGYSIMVISSSPTEIMTGENTL